MEGKSINEKLIRILAIEKMLSEKVMNIEQIQAKLKKDWLIDACADTIKRDISVLDLFYDMKHIKDGGRNYYKLDKDVRLK